MSRMMGTPNAKSCNFPSNAADGTAHVPPSKCNTRRGRGGAIRQVRTGKEEADRNEGKHFTL
jgi:hypothetical protein